jgi:hypothetical protein
MAGRRQLKGKGIENEYLPKLVNAQPGEEKEEGGDEEPCNQTCYIFNDALSGDCDNRKCRNCKKYLTTLCDQIEQFIDEDGEVDE